jgi:hypothetical protein
MLTTLLNKILFLFFFLACFNILKHIWKVFIKLREEDVPNKYELPKNELILLGISIAYLLTTIFTGITI